MTLYNIFYDYIDQRYKMFTWRPGECEHCGENAMIHLCITEPRGPCIVENCLDCLIENNFVLVEVVDVA